MTSANIKHKKKQWHMMLEIQFLAWDMYINVVVFNWLMGSHFEINTKYLFF